MTKIPQSHRLSELTISRIADLIEWLPVENGTRAIEEAISIIHTQLAERNNPVSVKQVLEMCDEVLNFWPLDPDDHADTISGLEKIKGMPYKGVAEIAAGLSSAEDYDALCEMAEMNASHAAS